MLFILLIFVSLIAVSGVSAADADAGDVVAISDVDDSDVLAVDNEAEPMSVDVAQETDVVAAGNSSFNIGNITGNGSSFNLGNLTGNGSSFNFGNGTSFNFGNSTGNGSSFSFGNGSSFSFNGTFSFGNTTGNGSFDIGSILGMLGGGSSKDTIEAADLTKYYTKTTTFKTTVKNGNQTLSTGSVVFTIKNKEYVGHIGSDGVASVSLKALKPGTYYIFAEYGQTIVKNVIKIKKSVITKNVSKKYKKAGGLKRTGEDLYGPRPNEPIICS